MNRKIEIDGAPLDAATAEAGLYAGAADVLLVKTDAGWFSVETGVQEFPESVRVARLVEIPDAPPVVSAPAPVPVPNGKVGVRYIGKKAEHSDRLYGTGLRFAPGQVHPVDASTARKMAAHTDIYELLGTAQTAPQPVAASEPPAVSKEETEERQREDDERRNAPLLVDLGRMDKPALIDYAEKNFGAKLHPSMKEENMRAKIAALANSK